MATIEKPRSAFGNKLRAELERQDSSIRKLAHTMAGPSPSREQWEASRRLLTKWIAAGPPEPSKASRRAVAEALGLDPSFFDEDDEEDHQLARELLSVLRRVVETEKPLELKGI